MIGYVPPTYEEIKQLNATPKMYFRCHDCLAVVCTTDLRHTMRFSVTCGICGGHMDYMGDVKGNRYYHKVEVCACNEVCQTARGPKCTCSCGGENHGSGFKYRLVITKEGAVIEAESDAEKCLAIAAEFNEAKRNALARINAKFGQTWIDFQRGNWISDKSLWMDCNVTQQQYEAACNGTMQKSRIAKLNAIATTKG